MPDTADRDIDSIPRVGGVDADELPESVLQEVIRRLQAADQRGYSTSAFENYIGGGALLDAA